MAVKPKPTVSKTESVGVVSPVSPIISVQPPVSEIAAVRSTETRNDVIIGNSKPALQTEAVISASEPVKVAKEKKVASEKPVKVVAKSVEIKSEEVPPLTEADKPAGLVTAKKDIKVEEMKVKNESSNLVSPSTSEIAAVQSTETRNDEIKNENKTSEAKPVEVVAPVAEIKKPYVVPASTNQPVQRGFIRPNMAPRVPFQPRFGPVHTPYARVAPEPVITEEVSGILEITGTDGRGILRQGFRPGEDDILIPSMVSRLSKLRAGDVVTGLARRPKENEPYWTMIQVTKVNGEEPAKMFDRFKFEKGTPIYPFEKLKLETGKEVLSTRLIDLCAPIGRGQRGLIVSPPKAGKTTIIKEIASGIAANYPEIHLMAVLVGERPEEVTDISRHILAVTKNSVRPGETAASNFDEKAEEQTRVAEMALERAKRLVELGQDVVILLDSITRLARAYNLAIPTSGRTLSGGFDPAALYPPKKFFGAARKIEGGGSLTIIGTALTDTGSRMDDLVYEEFKGTGNMELHLDRRLAERRIYPAIDVMRSGTRRDDLLFDSVEYQSIVLMRRMLDMLGDNERTEVISGRIARTKSNKEFLATLKDGG